MLEEMRREEDGRKEGRRRWGGGGGGGGGREKGECTIYFHNSRNVTRYVKDDQQKKRNVQAVSVHVLTQFPTNSANELCKKCKKRGCTSDGVSVPCIYTHAR